MLRRFLNRTNYWERLVKRRTGLCLGQVREPGRSDGRILMSIWKIQTCVPQVFDYPHYGSGQPTNESGDFAEGVQTGKPFFWWRGDGEFRTIDETEETAEPSNFPFDRAFHTKWLVKKTIRGGYFLERRNYSGRAFTNCARLFLPAVHLPFGCRRCFGVCLDVG